MYTWVDLLSIGAALPVVSAAAVVDYKTLKIPNRLTVPLIFTGVALMAVRCLLGFPAMIAALTCIIAYSFAYALWRGHMWGGGDAKLALALFILVSPVYPPLEFIVVFSLFLALMVLVRYLALDVPALLKKRLPHGLLRPMGPLFLLAYLLAVTAFAVGQSA